MSVSQRGEVAAIRGAGNGTILSSTGINFVNRLAVGVYQIQTTKQFAATECIVLANAIETDVFTNVNQADARTFVLETFDQTFTLVDGDWCFLVERIVK